MFNEVLTYLILSMLRSLFSGSSSSSLRFYANPPVAYGIVSFPHCGYYVGVEWIGKALMYPVTGPFVLGSPGMAEACASLKDVNYSDSVEVSCSGDEWGCIQQPAMDRHSWLGR